MTDIAIEQRETYSRDIDARRYDVAKNEGEYRECPTPYPASFDGTTWRYLTMVCCECGTRHVVSHTEFGAFMACDTGHMGIEDTAQWIAQCDLATIDCNRVELYTDMVTGILNATAPERFTETAWAQVQRSACDEILHRVITQNMFALQIIAQAAWDAHRVWHYGSAWQHTLHLAAATKQYQQEQE